MTKISYYVTTAIDTATLGRRAGSFMVVPYFLVDVVEDVVEVVGVAHEQICPLVLIQEGYRLLQSHLHLPLSEGYLLLTWRLSVTLCLRWMLPLVPLLPLLMQVMLLTPSLPYMLILNNYGLLTPGLSTT